MTPARSLAAVLALALVLVGCGSSASDKAKTEVCNSRADIQKQIESLKGLPLAPSSISAAKDTLKAIKADIKTIAGAQPDLAGDRKQQVQQANTQFKSQLQQIATNFTQNLSLTNAQQQVNTAINQLTTAYKQSLGKVNCS
jgi:PBP1b-binding outer membrane lipoprotein LpoB